jgi:hypothetical protein
MRTVAIGNLTPETVAAAVSLAYKSGQVGGWAGWLAGWLAGCRPGPTRSFSPSWRCSRLLRRGRRPPGSSCFLPLRPTRPPPSPSQVVELQSPAPADAVHRAKLALDGCEGSVVLVVYDTVRGPPACRCCCRCCLGIAPSPAPFALHWPYCTGRQATSMPGALSVVPEVSGDVLVNG